MQLNTLTPNPDTFSTQNIFTKPIYDHKLARIQSEIFILPKKHSFQSSQSQLYKFNVYSLLLQPVYASNSLGFDEFLVFSFHEKLYFLGKTSLSKKCQLYYFEENRFTEAQQKGEVPQLYGRITFTFFSYQYLLCFGRFNKNLFLNDWYLLDIQNLTWIKVVTVQQLTLSNNFSLIRADGKIFLLTQTSQSEQPQQHTISSLYEIKIKGFNDFTLTFEEIQIPPQFKSKYVLEKLLCSQEKKMLILSNSKDHLSEDEIRKRYILKLNLETLEWEGPVKQITLKGPQNQIIQFEKKLYVFSGHSYEELEQNFQIIQLSLQKRFPYEQSSCYYCQQAFTYRHVHSQEPIIEIQEEYFPAVTKIQNKALKKLSGKICNELKAVGLLSGFFTCLQCPTLHITLKESMGLNLSESQRKKMIEQFPSQVLCLSARSNRTYSKQNLLRSMQGQANAIEHKELLRVSEMINTLKASAFKLGQSILFVFKTSEKETLVVFFSYSQIYMPQSSFSASEFLWYTIKSVKEKQFVSSPNNRHIIFENVKTYFGRPQSYERNQINLSKRDQPQITLFIMGITQLQKGFTRLSKSNKLVQDFRIKGLNSQHSSNSLYRYLRALELKTEENQKKLLSFYLEGEKIQRLNLKKQFQILETGGYCKSIKFYDQKHQTKFVKELEETHFSTHEDETCYFKKSWLLESSQIYIIREKKLIEPDFPVKLIYVYHNNKLLKTYKSSRQIICGFIQLRKSIQVDLFKQDLQNKKERKQLQLWFKHLQNFCSEQ